MADRPPDYSEDALVEQPAIALFRDLRWDTANCYHETFGVNSTLGRETGAEVVLVRRLRAALRKLNPDMPDEAIEQAVEELTRDRGVMTPAAANREIYGLLKNGVKVSFKNEAGAETKERVKVVDWETPGNNDFFLASQFWVTGEIYKRRADLVGFVNGLPMVFLELKASHKRLKTAYDRNLRDYKSTVPQVFWHNAFIILSNGSESRIGSITSDWDYFVTWKKINSEGEEGVVSLETMIRGTCAPDRFIDLLENFILFEEAEGGLIKLVAKNHQYLGTNNAVEAVKHVQDNRGRLGVFWHTQGSGKSYSMVFFSQKILRKFHGNYTFVVVTDRDELDNQIYKNFANVGAVTPKDEKRVRAQSAEHLNQLLREDHRYVFTLIQKFRTEDGSQYPVLSERSDIIVMTDEAHRSQYDLFALNMRNALPHAAFIGFTGTPLMAGEEKTREVFGDYVSVYNFKQSVDDKATVPLFYENRIPELQLKNDDLHEDMEELLEAAELDEDQEKKLMREFSREYHLITRDERLEKIAEDIVAHFMGRGLRGKAMVISIDKLTAVRMFDKVQKHWRLNLAGLEAGLETAGESEREDLVKTIAYMKETEMAVVVSQSQNEVEDFRKKGVEIEPHRRRIVKEDMAKKFKTADDPFRIVFLCAMWMTGFDVKSCSTLYLDKPMKNHTLMQTIARANRVFRDKVNGLIVDYVGVFRNLQKALAIYAAGAAAGEMPVKAKDELVRILKEAIEKTRAFCADCGIDLEKIPAAYGLDRVRLIDEAVEKLLVNDETKRKFLSLAGDVDRIFRAILPDPTANEFGPPRKLFCVLADKIRSLGPETDITGVMEDVEKLLDESIATEGYVIRRPTGPADTDHLVDLSKIDFEALKKRFAGNRRRTEIEKLRAAISLKLSVLIRYNKSRIDYYEKFQRMIEEYNAGSKNVEEIFKELVAFAQELTIEEKRHIKEQLLEEELTLFDILTRPKLKLARKDELQVKTVARELLETLKKEKLVLDWRKRQQTRAGVELCIKETLDRLPEVYTPEIYESKCSLVYQHVYDSYYGDGKSVYELAG